jgi:hypothetical protein
MLLTACSYESVCHAVTPLDERCALPYGGCARARLPRACEAAAPRGCARGPWRGQARAGSLQWVQLPPVHFPYIFPYTAPTIAHPHRCAPTLTDAHVGCVQVPAEADAMQEAFGDRLERIDNPSVTEVHPPAPTLLLPHYPHTTAPPLPQPPVCIHMPSHMLRLMPRHGRYLRLLAMRATSDRVRRRRCDCALSVRACAPSSLLTSWARRRGSSSATAMCSCATSTCPPLCNGGATAGHATSCKPSRPTRSSRRSRLRGRRSRSWCSTAAARSAWPSSCSQSAHKSGMSSAGRRPRTSSLRPSSAKASRLYAACPSLRAAWRTRVRRNMRVVACVGVCRRVRAPCPCPSMLHVC